MTINNPEQFCKSLWDWGCLDGCFGQTRIKPTDIDGFVERKGHFLLFETKLPGADIPEGQWITFNQLLKTGKFSIIIVWGKPGIPEEIKVLTGKHERNYKDIDLLKLRDVVSSWFKWANK
jgi:hypothetical protein